MKILIIEDEQELAKSIAEYLSDEKYLCEFASTYHQALEKIGIYHYDCILLDIMLPDGDGMKILDKSDATSSLITKMIFLSINKQITHFLLHLLHRKFIYEQSLSRRITHFSHIKRCCFAFTTSL